MHHNAWYVFNLRKSYANGYTVSGIATNADCAR